MLWLPQCRWAPPPPSHMAPDPCTMRPEGDAGGPRQLCVTAAWRPRQSLGVQDSGTALRPASSLLPFTQERAEDTPGHVQTGANPGALSRATHSGGSTVMGWWGRGEALRPSSHRTACGHHRQKRRGRSSPEPRPTPSSRTSGLRTGGRGGGEYTSVV